MNNTKLGFNNFKAFGPKMQYFSKKPITLIYGPNSVGKSSLLHSQLISAYYFQSEGNHYNFNKNSFAGDELDLGGFDRFIHKHDTSESITYEYVSNEEKDILWAFNIAELSGLEILEEYLNIDYINEKFESEYKQTGIKFKYIFEGLVSVAKFSLESMHNKFTDENELNIDREKSHESSFKNYEEALCEYYHDSIDNISKEQMDMFNKIYVEAEDEFLETKNPFETLMFETLQINPLEILERLNFFKILKEVSEIKVTNILSKDGFSQFTVYIDNEILYEENNTGIYVNEKNYYLSISNELSHKLEIYISPVDIFKKYADFHFNLVLILSRTVGAKSQIQYFGPLRHYPERFELFIIEDLEKREESRIAKFSVLMTNWAWNSEKNTILYFSLLLFIGLYYRTLISPKSFFEFDFMGLLIGIPFLFILFNGAYNILNKTDSGKEKLNFILPKRFRLLKDKVINSYDIWKILSKSRDTVDKLNLWLGDNTKLKSNYSIKVVKKPITYLGILGRQIAKIFELENESGLSDSSWENNKIKKSIANFWNNIERKLNIQQRYESQVVFTDIAKNTEVTPRDMGLGISQILPIMISTFNAKNTKLYLEQPELHLHPAVQMEITDEFIRSANEQNNEFMIETHSEHLLLRIMRRMRQTADGTLEDESLRLTPDDVCLLYVDNDGGFTYLQELRLSPKGRLLDHWPHGFFEEGYKERFS